MADLKLIQPQNDTKKALFCHRMYIPIPFAEPVTDMVGKQIGMKPAGDVRFLQCLKNQCALWDDGSQGCGDLLQAKALHDINTLMIAEKIRRENETIITQDGN